MGWFGYGLYDGDDTFTKQCTMLEAAGFKKNIPLLKGGTIDEVFDWDIKDKLANSVVQTVYDNWEKIEKKCIPKIRKNILNEDVAMEHLMAADFFMKHKAQMPDGVQEKGLTAAQFLITQGHADDFDNPQARKRVLSNFAQKLEEFVPFIKFNEINVEDIIQKAHQKNYDITNNFDKAVKWLFDEKNKYLILSEFEKVLAEGKNNFAEFNFAKFKEGLNFYPFGFPEYYSLPKTISSKLSPDEVDLLQEIVQNDLTSHYKIDIIRFKKVINRVRSAEEELKKASDELESFVQPVIKKKKM